MANKNQVTITFAGDEKDLDRSMKAVEQQVDKTGDAFDKLGADADQASRRLQHVADSADEVDTLGSKATSSLGALSSGFELLGGQGEAMAQALMTASLATDALSGAGEAAFIATTQLRGVVDKAKLAWEGFSMATKASVVALGVAGAALAALGVVYAVVNQRTQDVKQKTQGYVDTLDDLTGATTRATREMIYKNLVEKDAIAQGRALGLSSRTLVDAALGERDALAEVNRVLDEHESAAIANAFASDSLSAKSAKLRESLGIETEAVKKSKDQLLDEKAAVDATTDAFDEQKQATDAAREAQQAYAQAVQDQFDPMANLIHRLDDVRTAQAEYNKAIKEHGRNSQEARDANLRLAEAVIAADAAAANASGTFDGKLSPALRDTLRAGGLTEAQIADIETAFKRAEKAGDRYAKTYKAKAILDTKDLFGSLAAARNALEGSGYVSGRASGGQTEAARVYQWQENGKEFFVSNTDGYVLNAAQTAQMMSSSYGGTAYAAPAAGGSTVLEVRPAGVGMDDWFYQLIQKGLSTGRLVIRQSQVRQ